MEKLKKKEHKENDLKTTSWSDTGGRRGWSFNTTKKVKEEKDEKEKRGRVTGRGSSRAVRSQYGHGQH